MVEIKKDFIKYLKDYIYIMFEQKKIPNEFISFFNKYSYKVYNLQELLQIEETLRLENKIITLCSTEEENSNIHFKMYHLNIQVLLENVGYIIRKIEKNGENDTLDFLFLEDEDYIMYDRIRKGVL